MISAAICWASAALPPLPMIRSLLPARSAATTTAALLCALASKAASSVARSRAVSESFRWAAIGSFDSGLKAHRQGLQTSLVMIAPGLRKRTRSMRNAGSGLGQHAPGDVDDVGRRNVPHAAMVVHGADRAVAGLAGHHGPGLNRCRKAIQRRPVIGAGGAENAHGRRSQRGGDMHQPGIIGDR